MIAMRRCYAISIIGMEGKNMNHNKKKILKVTALFVLMFFLGWGAGSLQKQQMKKTVETVSVQNQADNWGLGFGAEGTQPTGNVTADELKKYNAWYVGDKNKKIIYLTFDCGYENGNIIVYGIIFRSSAGYRKAHGGRGACRWQSYLSSPGYVIHIGAGFIPKGNR